MKHYSELKSFILLSNPKHFVKLSEKQTESLYIYSKNNLCLIDGEESHKIKCLIIIEMLLQFIKMISFNRNIYLLRHFRKLLINSLKYVQLNFFLNFLIVQLLYCLLFIFKLKRLNDSLVFINTETKRTNCKRKCFFFIFDKQNHICESIKQQKQSFVFTLNKLTLDWCTLVKNMLN